MQILDECGKFVIDKSFKKKRTKRTDGSNLQERNQSQNVHTDTLPNDDDDNVLQNLTLVFVFRKM